ncbi:phage tail protein [Erythrobacter sp. W302b]|uniref:phage tail protein n=1 Tax=Erythrobacter sp. W302b TaxID=3389874 RepID=UPI00396B00DC
MAEPFLAEVRLASFVFPPKGWALCNGQLLPINQNQGLFSLLGTTFGGDGRVNFALPDMRGRVPIHVGNGFTLGERGGEEVHTLTVSELPQHNHTVSMTTTDGSVVVPANNQLGSFNNAYGAPANLVALAPATVTNVGGSQPHENRSPFLVVSYIIALQGIFPSAS